jgi:hypothetical protein
MHRLQFRAQIIQYRLDVSLPAICRRFVVWRNASVTFFFDVGGLMLYDVDLVNLICVSDEGKCLVDLSRLY